MAKLTQVQAKLTAVLTNPTPQALWQLRGQLLQAGLPLDASAMHILTEFFQFLNELAASATSREYSHFASLLDVGAVGGVAVQNLWDVSQGVDDWWQRLLVGGLSEGLMVLAARQYVKAWEEEMQASYNAAAWTLFAEMWQLSSRYQPDLDSSQRHAHLQRLFAPLQQKEVNGTAKAAVIGRLFQILLLIHLQENLAATQ